MTSKNNFFCANSDIPLFAEKYFRETIFVESRSKRRHFCRQLVEAEAAAAEYRWWPQGISERKDKHGRKFSRFNNRTPSLSSYVIADFPQIARINIVLFFSQVRAGGGGAVRDCDRAGVQVGELGRLQDGREGRLHDHHGGGDDFLKIL